MAKMKSGEYKIPDVDLNNEEYDFNQENEEKNTEDGEIKENKEESE